MEVKTYLVGGSEKFANRFISKINERLNGELTLNVIHHIEWDNYGNHRRWITKGAELVLVIKSNVNHSLRDWAKDKADSQGIMFCECSHKVAIAELDLRHLFDMELVAPEPDTLEELSLADLWDKDQGDRALAVIYNTYGDHTKNAELYNGARNPYGRMPWVAQGKQAMLTRWATLFESAIKSWHSERGFGDSLPLPPRKALKSVFSNLTPFLKKVDRTTNAGVEVGDWASAWIMDAHLSDFRGVKNVDYALNMIFGESLDSISEEARSRVHNFFNPTLEVPEITLEETTLEETTLEVTPTLEEPILTDYATIGGVTFSPSNDCPIHLGEINTNGAPVVIFGKVKMKIESITSTTLHNVTISKEI